MENYFKCRLCLEESTQNINIFKEETFSKMIELLTGLKVDPKDGLPTNSCLQCHKEVKSAMLTRYQIINSHKILINELKTHLNNKAPNSNIKLEQYFDSDYAQDHNSISYSSDETDNEFVESDIKHFGPIKDENTSHLEIHQSNKLLAQINFKDLELTEQKCHETRNDDFDDYDSGEDSGEENDKSYNFSINNKSIISDKSVKKIDDIEIRPTENKKQVLKKLGNKRNISHQEVKFKRKRCYRGKSLQKPVQFKKKGPTDHYHVKVDYDIKPEHMEFLKTFGKKDRVACPICQREMYGMNMKNHLITHNFDPVICDTCGKTSKNAQALQDHINYYHKTTPDRFMCDKCGKGYRVRFMLERHEKKEHGNGEKDYECTICGKKFFEKLQLKNHINITHNKIKPFKCEHCGKDFGRRTQFVTHQLVHTKENRYHCQVCQKGFKIKQTMQTHLKGVHGIEEEKIIFCKICQKGFSSAQGLRAHVNSRVHGLEKCEHCSEYITLEYKDIHLKEIHGIEPKNGFS